MTVELAYRYSDYDTGITTDTWKIGADWAPTEDIRFRGSKQRSVRAANVIELFASQGFNLFDMTDDPCDAMCGPGMTCNPDTAQCEEENPCGECAPGEFCNTNLDPPQCEGL